MTVLLLLLLAAAPARGAGPDIVARVGSGTVTEADVADFQAVQGCYPEGLSSRRAGFMRQFETAIEEELLRRETGTGLGPEDYRAERERIDRETRAPDILACIKAKVDHDGRYERVYLRPILIQKRLYAFIAGKAPSVSPEAWFKSVPKLDARIDDSELKKWVGSIKGNPYLPALKLRK